MSQSLKHLENCDIMREMIKVLGKDSKGVDGQKMIPDDMGIIKDILTILGWGWDFGAWKDKVFAFNGRKFTSKQIAFVLEYLKKGPNYEFFIPP